ncbi:hypothetical protein BDZ97DRAFT_1753709 [Flammula alnicola]|nr:hypothetical protein BDZ97DRAFT_1753709 [Flammula alnicola]
MPLDVLFEACVLQRILPEGRLTIPQCGRHGGPLFGGTKGRTERKLFGLGIHLVCLGMNEQKAFLSLQRQQQQQQKQSQLPYTSYNITTMSPQAEGDAHGQGLQTDAEKLDTRDGVALRRDAARSYWRFGSSQV